MNIPLRTDEPGLTSFRGLRQQFEAGQTNNERTDGRGRRSAIIVEVDSSLVGVGPFELLQVTLGDDGETWEEIDTKSISNPSGFPIVGTEDNPQRIVAFHCGTLGYCFDGSREVLVELVEDLESAETGREADLPSALAAIMIENPDTDEGGDVAGPDRIRTYNRGVDVSFQSGLLGFVKQNLLRVPVFIPLDCGESVDSSDSSSDDLSNEIGAP